LLLGEMNIRKRQLCVKGILGILAQDMLVRHEDARCQWMRVPPEKLSVHLGSYLDSWVGRPSG
jgi:hypothetical protein